ncbi:class I SAM-dependent methyltransferase [Plantactinospora siamensis]|uniref:Class I SAM-dependent methyltransferase n=1 Tax=Plantactinospora siamensis TaxID=555372 RepID=A0ABV6P3D5_9ACTN
MERPASSVTGQPVTSPFAMPRGLLGRLAGLFMLRANRQDDLLNLLDVRAGERVLEVGYGPGALIRLIAERTGATLVQGVDPAREMRTLAAKNNRAAIQTGRVDLRIGSAARTGLPDGSVDRIVSVNTVAIWPDLDAGLRELRRVLRPGGTLLIAWHGGTAPSAIGRRLRLPEGKLHRLDQALREHVGPVSRHPLAALDVFIARG